MLRAEVIRGLNNSVAGAQEDALTHCAHLTDAPTDLGSALEVLRERGCHRERDSHGLGLGQCMQQHGGLPRVHRNAMGVEVAVHGLQPKSRLRCLRPLGANAPEQPPMGSASRMMRPLGVADQEHFVPSVRKQWQDALALVIEPVRRPAYLGSPKEAQLAGSILVRAHAPCMLHRRGLAPSRDLLLGQSAELLLPDGITVAPVCETIWA
mmetsp:Transcript_101746/g.283311  ORF Transcript_101746/g.283311 Transcript_101746/m.283311 type:complete len:209 (-) Transcript_101746:511-1137(-)